ncbi:MAG: tryptophan-rich sensory protein [Deltaproteobacteria bacterium]|nr:tryptophan-rich sensory protein [Deltaproteobacteria bacterium]
MKSNWNLLRFGNILTYLVVVIVNSIAGAIGINGLQTGAISDKYATLIAPAGYVFSIWGVIYLLLLGFVVYQFSAKRKDSPFQEKIGYLFIASCIINICWLLLWHYEMIAASVILMLGLLLTLITIYTRLGIGVEKVPRNEMLLVHLPFSVYLGWITVATIANIAAALVSLGQPELILGAVNWTILVIVVAVLITGMVLWTRRDVAYAAVLIWALIGVYMKQSSLIPQVAYAAIIGAAIIAVDAVIVTLRNRNK